MNLDEVLSPLRWRGGALELIDQRVLPREETWVACRDYRAVARAIKEMIVRGAPAIGCAAAYGVALGVRDGEPLDKVLAVLRATRPTAVNLFWALDRMARVQPHRFEAFEQEAIAIHHEDIRACLAIGEHGAGLLPEGTVLTHCNAGALATAGYGTALGVIRRAWALGKRFRVFADETRPVLQGARLTAWELARDHIPVEVIADNMAGALMAQGEIQAAIVGADRISNNGDVANKIGTYTVAVLCRHHQIPFYVAAPWTTIDPSLPTGADIPIEQRHPDEVRTHGGRVLTPSGVGVRNPAFDVTPAPLVTAIITERGVFTPDQIAIVARQR